MTPGVTVHARGGSLAFLWAVTVSAFAGLVPGQDPPPPGAAVDLSSVTLNESRLRVHFIDSGPGMAVLIETPNGSHIFVDGGKWGLDDMETYVRHFARDSNGTLVPIDIAIVTHPDFDHFSGMRRIFNQYAVRQFWYTGYNSDELSGSWRTFEQEVEAEEGCEIYWPLSDYNEPGDRETIDDLGTPNDPSDDVIILYLNVDSDPPDQDPVFGRTFTEAERRNNASFVFKLIYRDVSFLFTGDINGRDKSHTSTATDNEIDSEELELWTRHSLEPAKYSLTATVLQVPHHGSNGSSSLPFLRAVNPRWAVIPAGHEHDHPTQATLRRLGQVVHDARTHPSNGRWRLHS